MALVLTCLLWGCTFVLVKDTLAGVSTVLFLALRFSVAALALGVGFRVWRLWPREGRAWQAGAWAGLFLFGGYLFQTWGLERTTPTKSAFLTALSVVLVPLLVSLRRREALRPAEALGAVVATVGIGLLTLSGGDWRSVNAGDLLTLLCAVAYSIHILIVAHYSKGGIDFRFLSIAQLAACALLASASFWWIETPRVQWTAGLGAAVATTGLLATALAFSLMAWAQQHTSPSRAALIFALEPVFAAMTSFALAGERLAAQGVAGAVLILAGILVVELKPGRGD